MRSATIIARCPKLEALELTAWIEQGWVRPASAGTEWEFESVDVARVDLLYDLRYRLGVAAEALPMILSLLDQVYDLRATLKRVSSALDAQPPAVRAAVLEAMKP